MKRGAALPTMLLVISMTSALAVGGVFVARQMAGNTRILEYAAGLEPLAGSALGRAIVGWDSLARSAQPIGTTAGSAATAAENAQTDVWITRLSDRAYWLVAETRGTSRPRLRRRLGVVVRVTGGVPGVVPQRGWSELP